MLQPLCYCCLTCSLAAFCSLASGQIPIRLLIANHSETWEYSFQPGNRAVNLVAHSTKAGDQSNEGLVMALREERERWERRQTLPRTPDIPGGAKWWDISPNCEFAVAGSETSIPRSSATLIARKSRQPVLELKLPQSDSLEDLAWSPDSKQVVIVLSTERYSTSLSGFIARIFGHPIPLKTISARWVDTASGKYTSTEIARDVPYGTIVIRDKTPPCTEIRSRK